MDLYTTSFTLPRSSPHSISATSPLPPASLALPPSTSFPPLQLPNVTTAPASSAPSSSLSLTSSARIEKDWLAVQTLAMEVTSREGCLVTVTRGQSGVELGSSPPLPSGDSDAPIPNTTRWDLHLSGNYQSVMAARGAILREVPRDNRTVLKVPRTDILDSPLATISPLKPDVRRRLDEIAADSRAHIAVVNVELPGSSGIGGAVLATADGQASDLSRAQSGEPGLHGNGVPNGNGLGISDGVKDDKNGNGVSGQSTGSGSASGPSGSGLETERMCELVMTGSIESVEIAKVRLLVMLDELSGLHSECCDIDYKLHGIIAARKRAVIQSIQEETATNIYYPTPLVGVLSPPQPGQPQGQGYRNMHYPGTMSVQHTGMGMQMTGNMSMGSGMSHHPQHLAPMGMLGPQMTGMSGISGMSGMSSMMGGTPLGPMRGHHSQHAHSQGYSQHHPRNTAPQYIPQQHVHYPYSPQPMEFDPSTTRGMPYAGSASSQYPNMNGVAPGPMRMDHTGMSSMPVHNGWGNVRPPGYMDNHMMQPPHPGHNGGAHGGMLYGGGHAHGHSPHPPPHLAMGMHDAGVRGSPMGNGNGMMAPHMTGMGVPGYGQVPHPGLAIHSGEQGALGKANQIWITGEFFGVQRARDMLLNVASQKSRLVISRDTAVLPRKLDWLLTERLDDVKNIMSDNGTYIQVPSVGSQASLITVFGDHRVNIERTIRSLMALTCQFYIASLWLLPMAFDVLMPQASLNPAQMQPILKRISHASGAEVVFKNNCFEMHGLEQEVRTAMMLVMELDIIRSFHHEIRFQIELANEHRDFISGKKNGKINKIMKLAGVRIKFETFNDYNFLMDIAGADIGAIQGLGMLQEELPAEVSFHIPEIYHKRIIGVGGKNIQRIMKTYGVYVKFSNAEEFAALGGYLDNEDNVVARTPAKNAMNLESLKQAVMELVSPKDKDYTVESVSIPRRYHRTLLGEKSIFIHDIEHKTNSLVRFPYKETASDAVSIFGPESQVHIAAAMLLDHVPFEADLHVPPDDALPALVSSTEFILFAENIKRDHQIAIVPSAKFGQGSEAIFKFRCQRSNIDFLATARDALEDFLKQHNVTLYPGAPGKDTPRLFTDAFSHFNSKLLSNRQKGTAAEGEGEQTVDRRRRQSTDVKALFDGPQPPVENGATGFAGPLSYDARRVSEFWQPPPSSAQSRNENEPSKRDSDPILQEKLRHATAAAPHGPPHRGMSARTQSLDITSLNFSRTLSGGSPFAPVPPSPTGNNGSGGFYPTHHGAHSVSAGPGKAFTLDTNIESITQGMSNVQVSQPHP